MNSPLIVGIGKMGSQAVELMRDMNPISIDNAAPLADFRSITSAIASSVPNPNNPLYICLFAPDNATDSLVQEIGVTADRFHGQRFIVIDFSNAHFQKSSGRAKQLSLKGIEYIGAGISGGTSIYANGASIFHDQYTEDPCVEKIFLALCKGDPRRIVDCGPNPNGHLVKSVHNSLEYIELSLLSSCFEGLSAAIGSLPHDFIRSLMSPRYRSYLADIMFANLEENYGDRLGSKKRHDIAENGSVRSLIEYCFDNRIPIRLPTCALNGRFAPRKTYCEAVTPLRAQSQVGLGDLFLRIIDAVRLYSIHEAIEILGHISHNSTQKLKEIFQVYSGFSVIRGDYWRAINELMSRSHNADDASRELYHGAKDELFGILSCLQPGCFWYIPPIFWSAISACAEDNGIITNFPISIARNRFGGHEKT
ncbi:hypothetical protein GH816_03030 [Betaproteobacteria bacterium LSUCC0115]|nr:hypothetical protein [Burkholderiales bacterium LSUCC0115]